MTLVPSPAHCVRRHTEPHGTTETAPAIGYLAPAGAHALVPQAGSLEGGLTPMLWPLAVTRPAPSTQAQSSLMKGHAQPEEMGADEESRPRRVPPT